MSGKGFSPGTKVEIVFGTPADRGRGKTQVVGSAVAQPDGTFRTSVVVPKARPGGHVLRVEGTSSGGRHMSLTSRVFVLADVTQSLRSGPGLAKPVLLTVSIALPVATWVALGFPAWRRRRLEPALPKRHRRS